jgi:predicted lactoylglutathione lyase
MGVESVQKSLAFYRDGLGLPAESILVEGDQLAIALGAGLYLVLVARSQFAEFTRVANQADAAVPSTECILSYFAVSREEVDTILQRARDAGAVAPRPPEKTPTGYTGYFQDPDGHLWEILWNAGFQAANTGTRKER